MRVTKKSEQIGFTLIEMLVVMAIIAVLAGVSLFALQGSREAARDARRKADLETIRSALELYKSDCNDYPSALTFDGTTQIKGDGTPTGCATTNIYLEDTPKDALSDRNYRYEQLTSTTYALCAALEASPSAVLDCGNPGGCGGTDCSYKVINP